MTRLVPGSFASVILVGALVGCSSPSAPALVKEETVCPSFEQGGQKMRGGLKKPVRLRVMQDDDVVATVMLFGIPDEKHPTRFKLPDKNDEYSLEYAQCANERAPQPEEVKGAQASKGAVGFVCNEPVVYTTVKHETKRGEPSTMELSFPPPPDTTCWRAVSAAAPASASASASAAPTASAEPAPSAEPSASAEAAPSASAEPAPSASAQPSPSSSAPSKK